MIFWNIIFLKLNGEYIKDWDNFRKSEKLLGNNEDKFQPINIAHYLEILTKDYRVLVIRNV